MEDDQRKHVREIRMHDWENPGKWAVEITIQGDAREDDDDAEPIKIPMSEGQIRRLSPGGDVLKLRRVRLSPDVDE